MQNKDKIIINILIGIVIIQSLLLLWFILSKKPKAVTKPTLPPIAAKGKIAIVLDDWGYELENIDLLNQIKEPLTISILPNLPYSFKICQEANRTKKEIILHLPLEPYANSGYKLEVDTIRIDMPEEKIRTILSQALMNMPLVKGVSNHMGSQATEDHRTMKIIFTELKKRKLYFLDSFVTPKSVCKELAQQIHIRFATRSVFLDNRRDTDYIKNQLHLLMNEAARDGFAVGIGHDRFLTLSILKEMMPKIKQDGFKFVYLSELVK